jgi:predicted membrane protein
LTFGLLFIFCGIVFMLEQSDIIENAQDLLRFWPFILVFAGMGKLVWPGSASGRISGLILVAFGSALLLEEFGLLAANVWDFWPILLVFLGIRLVWEGATGRRSVASDSASTVNAVAALGGASRRNNSADFRGGDLVAFMGGCEVDLRNARIQNGPAVIDAFAFWGGVEIRVPEEWVVTVEGIALLGAYEDSTRTLAEEGDMLRQELVVKGLAIMGGVEIKN